MDQDENEKTTPITLVISEVARLDRIQEYEAWAKGLIQAIEQFEGFIGVDVIRPSDHTHPEYVIIIIFDSYNDLKQCQESPIFAECMDRSQALIVGEAFIQKASGLEIWFTLPDASRYMPKPAYYKMVIVSVIAVYSIVLLVEVTLGPYLSRLPFLLSLFISIAIVSVFMTYPVMPYLTHWLNFWLYPTSISKHADQ